jgi:hypothetical protein
MIRLLGRQWGLTAFQHLFEHIGKENGDVFDIDSERCCHAGLGGYREGRELGLLPASQEFAIDLAKLLQD